MKPCPAPAPRGPVGIGRKGCDGHQSRRGAPTSVCTPHGSTELAWGTLPPPEAHQETLQIQELSPLWALPQPPVWPALRASPPEPRLLHPATGGASAALGQDRFSKPWPQVPPAGRACTPDLAARLTGGSSPSSLSQAKRGRAHPLILSPGGGSASPACRRLCGRQWCVSRGQAPPSWFLHPVPAPGGSGKAATAARTRLLRASWPGNGFFLSSFFFVFLHFHFKNEIAQII